MNLAVYLDVHIDCDSITGPGLPGRGFPSAQEVLDYIRFKFFKSAGPREPEKKRVGSEEQNVQSSDATTSLEEECSHVVEPGPQKEDTTVAHGDSGNESTPSEKLELGEATLSSTPLSLGAGVKEVPSAQDVLNLIADNYTNAINPASREELNGFLQYMEQVQQLLIVDVKEGSLIITTECSSLEILDELWKAHCTGTLNRMTQSLVTEDVLKTFEITEVKLITTIVEEEYEACREVFLKQGAGGYIY